MPARRVLLDEGLDVLTGLWSGEPFRYTGSRYEIQEVTFLPKPMQSPRIPIWVGGCAQVKAVVRRAAQYDGIMPYKGPADDQWQGFTPEDVQAMRNFIESERAVLETFDIAVGGRQRAEDWEQDRSLIASLAEASVTWWSEWVPATDRATMTKAVERGPLRIG